MNQTIGDLEFRCSTEFSRNAEIVRWQECEKYGRTCYTLARWIKDKEGYNLQFIGDRPLAPEVDMNDFFALVHYGQKICDAKFEFDEFMEYR